MKKLKAAIIGAGSTYTPELMEGFINKRESLNFQSFYLMDIDEKKLEVVGGLAKRMLKAKGFDGEIVFTADYDRAVEGADYVFGQIRTGGMQARILDEKIPLKHGLLGQETTGIGGFMNALRTVPVLLDIAHKIEKYAPDAWFVNFSNPSGIAADALLNHTKVKTIGLCNCPINMLKDVDRMLDRTDYDYDYVGLNHLAWITGVRVDGHDVLKDIDMGGGTIMKNVPAFSYDDELLRAIPALPSYYLSYYYLRDEQIKKCIDAPKTRGEICVELEESLIEKYKNPELNEKPAELASRGGALYSTAAVSVVDSIENDRNDCHVVNVKNNGALSFLDADDVVEIKCKAGHGGAIPVPVTQPQHPYIIGLIRAVKAYEKLAVSAAMNGSRADALAALMVHPLVGDYHRAKAALYEMIAANAANLPNFKL